jgi:hypothetical protein
MWHRRARGASFTRVTSTPEVVPARLWLGLCIGELVLDSGKHRRRARDSSFLDLRPHGGSSSLGGVVGEPMTLASVWEASTRMRWWRAHDSVVGKHDLVGSDDMPVTLASLLAVSLTWVQHILNGWFGVRHTLYFDFVGCTLYMCIIFSDTSQHIKRLFYPPMLGLRVSSLPLLMSGPAPGRRLVCAATLARPPEPQLSPCHSRFHLQISPQCTTRSTRGEG